MNTDILFSSFELSQPVAKAIEEMGYVSASPIQAEAIPKLMKGGDIIGQAQTGTGKTAAFGIPLVESISDDDKTVKALVMAPTRELAIQVAQELKKIAQFRRKINVLPVYGGDPIYKQINNLKRTVQIIVGTPGRLIDHLNRGTISLDDVSMVVLDEADEMLNMGFRDDIETILSHTPKERQTVLFSATMPKPILELSRKYMREPELIKVTRNELTSNQIEQCYLDIRRNEKSLMVARMMATKDLTYGLVFCNTKMMVDAVVEEVRALGLMADAIHGDLRQNQRNAVLSRFRAGELRLLVATDVAARGIDIENVDVVFNYDLPFDPENYVHRIGRTGRAGKTGVAYSFVTGRTDFRRIKDIEHYSKVPLTKVDPPSNADLFQLEKEKMFAKLTKEMESGNLKQYLGLMEEMRMLEMDMDQAMAALLKMILGDTGSLSQSAPPSAPSRNSRYDDGGGDGGRGRDRGGRSRDRDDSRGRSDSRGRDRRDDDRGRDRRDDRSERPSRRSEPAQVERSPRRRTTSEVPTPSTQGRFFQTSESMSKILITGGKNDNISKGDVLGVLTSKGGLVGQEVGAIEVYDQFASAEIPQDKVEKAIRKLKGEKLKGKKVRYEAAWD